MKLFRFTIVGLAVCMIHLSLVAQPLSDSLNISRIASFSFGENNPMGLAVQGSFAYVTDDAGVFRILDLTHLDSITVVGQCTLRSAASYGLALYQQYAFVTLNDSGMDVVNCSQPSQPMVVQSIPNVGIALDLAISAPYAYVAAWSSLTVLSLANLDSITVVGMYPTTGDAVAVKVQGNRLYVADNLAGFRIYDCSNPNALVELGGNNGQYSALNLDVQGDRLYIVSGYNGLNLYSVANPSVPQLLHNYTAVGSLMNVAVSNSYAYVAGYSSGFHVLNVLLQPNPIHRVGYYNPIPNVWKTLPIGPYCYTLENGQMSIYDVSPALWIEDDPQDQTAIPNDFELYPNFPNPFNSTTQIQYRLYKPMMVTLTLYDASGRQVRTFLHNVLQEAGIHRFSFQSEYLCSGVYFLRLSANTHSTQRSLMKTIPMVLLK
ncbi:MAG: T9SS type A sorting domain-containing protein [bacterium]|nr:T9SS type A sorting domain-containing protein [bacterium]